MRYCKLQNNTLQAPAQLPRDYKNILNFRKLPESKLNEYGFYLYEETPVLEHQHITGYQLDNGKAVAIIANIPETVLWDQVRRRRDELLTECDWTQVQDSPVDREAWAAYRQQLRDLPQNNTNPLAVEWPVKPFDL